MRNQAVTEEAKTAGAKVVFIRYTALAPIVQTEPSGRRSNRVYGRKIATAYRAGDGKVRHDPCVSGAGVRCPARELFCRLVFKSLDLADQKGVIKRGVPYELAETILKGGRSSIGDTTVKIAAGDYAEVYNSLPFFGLFGSFRFPGRLAVGFALPYTRERKEIEKLLGNPFADEDAVSDLDGARAHFAKMRLSAVEEEPKIKAVENFLEYLKKQSGLESLYQAAREAFTDHAEEGPPNINRVMEVIQADQNALTAVESFFGIHNSTRNAAGNNNTRYKTVQDKLKGLTRLQTLYTIEDYIPAGTVLLTRAVLLPGFGDDDLMEKTFHAYLEVLLARPVLGGMAARGFGFVHAEAKVRENGKDGTVKDFSDVSRAGEFWSWLEKNKEAVRHNLLYWFWPLVQGNDGELKERAVYAP